MSGTENISARRTPHPAGLAAASVELELQRMFYAQQAPKLISSLTGRGVHRLDVEAIVWNALAETWRRWDEIDNPEAWVKTVVPRELGRYLAGKKVEVPTDDVAALSAHASHNATDDWVQDNEIHRILAVLPPRQRQVLTLSIHEFTPTETAEALGITPAAACASLRKAKRNLAVHLDSRSEQP